MTESEDMMEARDSVLWAGDRVRAALGGLQDAAECLREADVDRQDPTARQLIDSLWGMAANARDVETAIAELHARMRTASAQAEQDIKALVESLKSPPE